MALSVEKIQDPYGVNLSKKTVISARPYAKVNITYVCNKCNKHYVTKEGEVPKDLNELGKKR